MPLIFIPCAILQALDKDLFILLRNLQALDKDLLIFVSYFYFIL